MAAPVVTRRRASLLAAFALVAGTGCSDGVRSGHATGIGGARDVTWSAVAVPDGFGPIALTAYGRGLLVGGKTPDRQVQPRLATLSAGGSLTEIPLAPESGYAYQATWRSITSHGDGIIAVGGAPGGAHSNTRWTVWTGDAGGVQEIEQVFGTFGGVGAGDVIGPVATTDGVLIAGTWQGARTGLDAAVWLPEADKWIRQPSAGSVLESTPDLLVTPHAATGWGPSAVLAGSVLQLKTGDVKEAAAAWKSQRLGGGWSRVDLPGAGRRSEAVSVSCTPAACLFAGYADGALALWTMSATHTRRLTGVPAVVADTGVKLPAPLAVGGGVVQVASEDGAVVVLSSAGDTWTTATGPAGVATGSGLAEGWLYVTTEQPDGSAVLWRCRLSEIVG